MGMVPEYTKNAAKRYNEKFDRLAVNLPKGTRERIKNLTGMSGNAYICQVVLDALDKIGNGQSKDFRNNCKNVDEIIQEEREVRQSRELCNPEVATMSAEDVDKWIKQKQDESAEIHKRENQRKSRGISTAGEIMDGLPEKIKPSAVDDKIPDALDAKIAEIKNRNRSE